MMMNDAARALIATMIDEGLAAISRGAGDSMENLVRFKSVSEKKNKSAITIMTFVAAE